MAELRTVSAFDQILRPVGVGEGVTVRDRDGIGIASVHALPRQAAAVAEALGRFCGAAVEDRPVRSGAGGRAAAGVGRGRWLVTAEGAADTLAGGLEAAVGAIAAVNDQSSGYTLLRLAGPNVRDVLAKGVDLDLHPAVFLPGSVAATAIGHVGVTLWRCADGRDGAMFEVALFRSTAGSFAHWLEIAASAYGLVVDTAPAE